MASQLYTPDEILTALRIAKGVKNEAAKILKCSRGTVVAYLDRYPEIRETLDKEILEEVVDDLETSLLELALGQKDLGAIRTALRALGKARGWGESTLINKHEGGIVLTIGIDPSLTGTRLDFGKAEAERALDEADSELDDDEEFDPELDA